MKTLINLVLLFILFYSLEFFWRGYECQKIQLQIKENTIQQEIKKNNIRIDKISLITMKLAEEYKGLGGFEDIFFDLKNNQTIGIDQKINDLPEDMQEIIIKQNIELHGLQNYTIFDKSYIHPMGSDSFIPSEWAELGWRPLLFDPVTFEYVYQKDNPVTKWTMHSGNDIVNYYNPNIYAVQSGEVIAIGDDVKGGLYVKIKHREKGKPIRVSRYFHLYQVNVIKGEYIKQGQIIGLMGESGKKTTGKHLHFEIKEYNGYRWIYKNFYIGTTHNRKWIAGYYKYKKDGRWKIKIL